MTYQGDTGIAELLQKQHADMVKVSESMHIDNMGRRIREIEYRLDMLEDKYSIKVSEPVRRVERAEFRLSPSLWQRIKSDPALEFFAPIP